MAISIEVWCLVVAVLVVFAAFLFVFAEQQHASADPFSWGKSPSRGWLNCYYSGSHDCTNVR